MSRPLIMLTNDDGIEADGIRALAEALLPLGELLVVAPSKQQSGMGRSFWSPGDGHFQRYEFSIDGQIVNAFHCDCTPAWIAHHGLHVLCGNRMPDLVVSGINHGLNLGWDLTVSGTVGAAMHTATFGIPSIAVSLQTHWYKPGFDIKTVDWHAAKFFAHKFAQKVLDNSLGFDFDVLNLNIPENASENTSWQKTRQGQHVYFDSILDEPKANSKLMDAKIIVNVPEDSVSEDSDIYTIVYKQEVSVTPLSLDFTCR